MTGEEFRKWRRSQEISQAEVAEKVKCHKTSICRWEKDQMNLTAELYERIMKFYEERI